MIQFALWLLAGLLITVSARAETARRLIFTGDVMLAREVAREIDQRRRSPWAALPDLTHADAVIGTLEGAVGDPAACPMDTAPCFAIRADRLSLAARAGFTAFTLANNHVMDLGQDGQRATRTALADAGLAGLGFADSPGFLRLGRRVVAIIALSLVPGRDQHADTLPSLALAQKLRLARRLADWVIVSIHWGREWQDWADTPQRTQAAWLIQQGADVIIGHHPHVVTPPECLDGRPVFFSLGNHIFDQKYPESKHGLMADCRIQGDHLSCQPLATRTPMGSSFPAPGPEMTNPLTACSVPARPVWQVGDWRLRPWAVEGQLTGGTLALEALGPQGQRWRSRPRPVLGIDAGPLAVGEAPKLVMLERHPSPLDGEDGPRPYVYDLGNTGLITRWRGSALAWPLLDTSLVTGADGVQRLCALHRGDSFLHLDPTTPETRTALYSWNGFGFAAAQEDAADQACRNLFPTP